MSLYSKISRKPSLFLSLTGISLREFQRLLPQFVSAYSQAEARRKATVVLTKQPRRRQPGGGAQFTTSVCDRLLMPLLYYRLYVTEEFLTLLFTCQSKSTISRGIRQMRPVLDAVLPVPERAFRRVVEVANSESKRRQKRISSLEEFNDAYPELAVIIDGTEQPKRRPKDPQKRKTEYSGRKKRHTNKQVIITTPGGLILHQSPRAGGRTHDSTLFRSDSKATAMLCGFGAVRLSGYFDSGFHQLDRLGLAISIRQVEQARRNRPLSNHQKKLNRLRRTTRIRVEHTIAQRKKYRIASETWRNRDEDYEPTMNVIAGLVNLRVYERIYQQTGIRS